MTINYLLFHNLVEVFSIAISWSVFAVTWNTRLHRSRVGDFLLLIGIASLFVGGIDLLHTLAYKGMNIFHGYDADLPTQLWIAARYTHSISFLAAAWILTLNGPGDISSNPRAPCLLLGAYTAVTALVIASIFSGVFPACFIEGSGLTLFKRVSEYIICALLAGAGLLLWRARSQLDREVLSPLLAAVFISILSELAFTLYDDVFGLFNIIGHVLKIIVFMALYRAIVLVGIQKPYAFLSRELRDSEIRYRTIVEHINDALFIFDFNTTIIDSNENARRMLGYSREELTGSSLSKITGPDYTRHISERMDALRKADALLLESEYIRSDGTPLMVEESLKVVSRGENGVIQSFVRDISKRKNAEEALRKALNTNRNMLNELQHRIKNSFAMIISMINIASKTAVSNDAKDALGELDSRVRSVSELYSILYANESFTDVRLDNYCRRIAAPLVSMARNITLTTNLETITVSMKLAAPIGLILTELITNAVKYAFPGDRHGGISVTLKAAGEGMFLEVRDDGVGLSAGFDPLEKSGLGLKLVQVLSGQVNAVFTMDSDGGGTRCVLELASVQNGFE